ncbi:LysR substrate-binding domain-containing protein [Gordonia hydrophobica]|uniref:LysR substrate-binding domain-containing protein n=1 Tax=Gordonia hydrophobica TaxID=40516 RepID=A0ABZ2TZ48_9ACTN|nr:LysR substrate-binding domain-containing protein [Gordonia hydrophobica]MBM7367207.1 DNA-binding transcriptional LysR family regulator [Gordonia hydrophobica]
MTIPEPAPEPHLPKLLDGRLKIRHLVLIDALSRQGSVIGAAAELHVTQPVATRSLRDIENVLGVELYTRGPRGIVPTIFGEAFTEHARAVLAQLNQAGRHVVELTNADRGTVVVGTHLAGSNVLLPQAIARIKSDHPLLTVIVREGAPSTLLTELEAGRVDMIVGRLTAPSTPAITRIPLYEESVEVFAGAGHPLATTPHLELADVGDHQWILPGVETSLRGELEKIFTRCGIPLPAQRVEATSYLTVRELLRETQMLAVLPSLIGRSDAHLTPLAVDLSAINHSVGLTVAADRPFSPSARALTASLRRVADEELR